MSIMNKITFTNDYTNADILVRVYKNQDKNCLEKEQIASEVLFKDREHQRAVSWLPKGASNFISGIINKLEDNNYNIVISNELDDNIGVLTSCIDNFNISIKNDLNMLL